jgi:hypothetical protein
MILLRDTWGQVGNRSHLTYPNLRFKLILALLTGPVRWSFRTQLALPIKLCRPPFTIAVV